jgi:hypothetical protein
MDNSDIIVNHDFLMARASKRHSAEMVIKVSIIGSKNKEEFLAKDISQTGVLIKTMSKSIPFQEGTIVEIDFPLESIIHRKDSSIKILGKVVRIDTESNHESTIKTRAGIKLIMNDAKEAKIWRMIMGMYQQQMLKGKKAA